MNFIEQETITRQQGIWKNQIPALLISNSIPDLLLILNHDNRIVYSNNRYLQYGNASQAEGYLGKQVGELLGCHWLVDKSGNCGRMDACKHCGIHKTLSSNRKDRAEVGECQVIRTNGHQAVDFKLWTSSVDVSEEQFTILTLQNVSLEKENAKLLEQVQTLAIMDPLTGVYNRRYFLEVANREVVRSLRYHNPFSIIMIDLDRLKEVNDTYGHPTGDLVIKEAVKLMRKGLREIDTLARYGGDEFILLLPETGMVGGQKLADRIMCLSDQAALIYKDFEIPIAFSAGVAEYQFEQDHDIDDVVTRADRELYAAKKRRKELRLD